MLYAFVAMRKVTVCLFLTLALRVLPAATGYLVHNLVADVASTTTPAADFIDPRLVNVWGLVASATSPFWTCDYGTGLSTIYTVNATNTTPLGTPNATTQPTVPGTGGLVKGPCTGIGQCRADDRTDIPCPAPGHAAAPVSFL